MPLALAGLPSGADADRPSGPVQRLAAGKNGQYVYWIACPFPSDEMLDSLRPPNSFTRQEFSELVCKAHGDCGDQLLETIVFLELHGHGKPHMNCLARASTNIAGRWSRRICTRSTRSASTSRLARMCSGGHARRWERALPGPTAPRGTSRRPQGQPARTPPYWDGPI